MTVGSESYRRACDTLRAECGASEDEAIRTRLEIACDNLDTAAQLYGQATALAGDRFSGPGDFLSTRAGWKVANRRQFYTLALANTTHFHPYAPREWWRYHRDALEHAIEASKQSGLDAVAGLQKALFQAAFADHFLHDAFSAGHMGFNRGGSSVAASIAFHDLWNARGRIIRDRDGNSWKTYGDGHLEMTANADGREHVVSVATLSVASVLRTFVLGARDEAAELEIWRSLPYAIDTPAKSSLTSAALGAHLTKPALYPLDAITWPARNDRVFDVTGLATSSFTGSAPTLAMLMGYQVSVPTLSAQLHVGGGATLPVDGQRARLAGLVGLSTPLGLTMEGLLDHHLCAGVLWEARYSAVAGSVFAGYRLDVELGRNLIQLQVGPAFVAPENALGFTAMLGFARVVSAAGGGVR